jgi:hypothetical protein
MAAVVGSDGSSFLFGGEAKRTGDAKRLKTQHKETSFSEKLRLLGDMESKKLPITLEASEEQVEEYMDVHGESLPFRWHYHSGIVFIDELNDAIS